jgi:hypothetical protein
MTAPASSRTGCERRSAMDQLFASDRYSASLLTFQQSKSPPWIFFTASIEVIIEWS